MWSRRGSLCKVRQDVGEKLASPQQVSEKLHVETWPGRCKSPQPQDFPGAGNRRKVCYGGVPPRTLLVTPVLPGPGSDIRMKMEWKIITKTEKSGVWFFQNAGSKWREVGASVAYGRCGLGMEGIVPHCVGGSLWFLVFLFVCVRATACWCVEGYRTPDEALVC